MSDPLKQVYADARDKTRAAAKERLGRGIVDPHGRLVSNRKSEGGCVSCDEKKDNLRPVLGGNSICMKCGAYQK